MNRQQQIDLFLAMAHELAVQRLRAEPARTADVSALPSRWRERSGTTRCDPYRDEWQSLLDAGVEELERVICADDERAELLRRARAA